LVSDDWFASFDASFFLKILFFFLFYMLPFPPKKVDYFGEQLAAQGYSYYGSEPLYSGVSGTIMHADIFIGVVYYQRLRHMVPEPFHLYFFVFF